MPTLEEYQKDIVASNTAAGWYEDTRTLGEECALLHSEISEMFEAYRDNEFKPYFHQVGLLGMGSGVMLQGVAPEGVKPEGVGSEVADVFIRLLDACHRLDMPIDEVFEASEAANVDVNGTFGDTITKLHKIVSDLYTSGNPLAMMGKLLASLQVVCSKYDLELTTEVDLKLAYNKTREYRHGGKTI